MTVQRTALVGLSRRRAAVGATLVSAVAYAAAFPLPAIRPLAFGSLAPFFVALNRTGPRGRIALAVLWTLISAYRLNDWFPRAVSTYYLQPAVVGLGFFAGVSLLTAAPGIVAFALAYPRIAQRSGPCAALLVGAAWVAGEWFRTAVTADPWALLGYSQAGVLPLMQIAAVGGVYAVSFVLAVANAALAQLVSARWRGAALPWGAGAAASAVVLVAILFGLVEDGEDTVRSAVPVAIVQGNLDLGSQWREEYYGRNLDRYLTLTTRVLETSPMPLVVWPESAMTFFLGSEPAYQRAIARVLAPRQAQLLAGGPYEEALPAGSRFFNAAYLLSPAGEVLGRYDKRQLLPFAEYFPLRAIDFLRREFGHVREFTHGRPTPPLPTAIGAAGVVICNEALFPAPARSHTNAGAVFLVNLANDGWLGDAKYSSQVLDMVTFRAVEQRRWVVRASTSGPSALIAPSGRITAGTAPFTESVLAGTIVPRTDRTAYALVGDTFAGLCAAVTVAALVRRSRRGTSA